jgi:hypothetical protein
MERRAVGWNYLENSNPSLPRWGVARGILVGFLARSSFYGRGWAWTTPENTGIPWSEPGKTRNTLE